MMTNSIFLLDNDNLSVVIGGNDGTAQSEANDTQAVTSVQADAQSTQTSSSSGLGGRLGGMGFFLYIVFLVAAFYFLAIRPQKKREKEIKEQQAGLQVGDDIRTSSGFYGKIVELEETKAVVEFGTNRGVRIPVAKSELFAVPKATDTEEK
jgi:preprotein translocase subunit YajC